MRLKRISRIWLAKAVGGMGGTSSTQWRIMENYQITNVVIPNPQELVDVRRFCGRGLVVALVIYIMWCIWRTLSVVGFLFVAYNWILWQIGAKNMFSLAPYIATVYWYSPSGWAWRWFEGSFLSQSSLWPHLLEKGVFFLVWCLHNHSYCAAVVLQTISDWAYN